MKGNQETYGLDPVQREQVRLNKLWCRKQGHRSQVNHIGKKEAIKKDYVFMISYK